MDEKRGRSRIIVGLLLIGFGIIFLLNNLGYLDWQVWRVFINSWPIILIIMGLSIIFYRSRFWWIIPVVLILFFGGIIIMGQTYNGTGSDLSFFHRGGDREYSGYYSFDRALDERIQELRVDVNYKALQLDIASLPESEEQLFSANLRYYGQKPGYSFREGETGYLKIHQQLNSSFMNLARLGRWRLAFNPRLPLKLNIAGGAGQLDLDLTGLQVTELELSSGASDLDIKYNDHSQQTKINSGASNIKLIIPGQAGVSIETSSFVSNNNFEEAGLQEIEKGVYQSENFKEADSKIRIDIAASASNVNLTYQ